MCSFLHMFPTLLVTLGFTDPFNQECGRALENGPRDQDYAASIAASIAAYVRCLYQVSPVNQTVLSQSTLLPEIKMLWTSATSTSKKNESNDDLLLIIRTSGQIPSSAKDSGTCIRSCYELLTCQLVLCLLLAECTQSECWQLSRRTALFQFQWKSVRARTASLDKSSGDNQLRHSSA